MNAELRTVPSAPFAPGSVSFGLYVPAVPPGEVGRALRDEAIRAVAAGFDGITVAEHHGQHGYVPQPVLVATSLAAVLENAWVGAAPVLAPLRSAAAIAEEVAWAALLTEGRFGVALAAGYDLTDFEAFGVPFETRAQRFRDTVTAVATQLADEPTSDDPALVLAGTRRPTVLVATRGPRHAALAGRQGLGLFLQPLATVVALGLVDRYRAAGGDGAVTLTCWAWLGEHPREGEERLNAHIAQVPGDLSWRDDDALIRVVSSDDPTQLAEQLAELTLSCGATSLNLRVRLPGVGLEMTVDQVEQIGQHVLPRLRERLRRGSTAAVRPLPEVS